MFKFNALVRVEAALLGAADAFRKPRQSHFERLERMAQGLRK
jgi:hypothetical protein